MGGQGPYRGQPVRAPLRNLRCPRTGPGPFRRQAPVALNRRWNRGAGSIAKGCEPREQVMEIINYVLADPSPEWEWARHQLRELLAEYPDEPERALLEHLIIIRELAAPLEDED